uniref:Uncharacterized protein n=1 Tax=viral metagenome TaxID=1070528 RepID=A0A6C0I5H0_9ZZZZ
MLSTNSITLFDDVRTYADFKGVSFTGYKKTDVIFQLIENMKRGKVEDSCHWCAELIAAGHYEDLWETIFLYFSKNIHLGNPKMILYLEMRYEYFKNILNSGKFLTELHLRNNESIRKLFAEAISILTVSSKTHSYEPVKVNRDDDFLFDNMSNKLKANNTSYAYPIMKTDDSKELHIAANEFSYHVSTSKDTMLACYWIEWVLEFDVVCRKKKLPCVTEHRKFVKVDCKYRNDPIWIIWASLLYYTEKMDNPAIGKIMDALLSIFSSRYNTNVCKKRRFLLYFAVDIITKPVNMNIEVISDKAVVRNVMDRIDTIYKEIIKTQIVPKPNYLIDGALPSNFNTSVAKLDILNNNS